MPIYNKEAGEDLEEINQIEKSFKFVTEEKIEEMEYIRTHVPKSQILK